MTHIVAITGKRGHGKSTGAEALEAQGFRHINFADPLRRVVEIVYGVTMEEMLDPVLKEKVLDRWPFKSPRELMQIVGTEMFRKTKFNDGEVLDDTWIQAFKREASRYSHVVCSDLRFPNEEGALRALTQEPVQGDLFSEAAEVQVIRIENPRVQNSDGAAQHASELAIDKIKADWTITNDRGVNDLHQAVRMLVGV